MRKSTVIKSEKTHKANVSGKVTVSFCCERDLWNKFDAFMIERYGNYKKSILIESMIRKFMNQKVRNTGTTEKGEAIVF